MGPQQHGTTFEQGRDAGVKEAASTLQGSRTLLYESSALTKSRPGEIQISTVEFLN